jgi:hypothetical protein
VCYGGTTLSARILQRELGVSYVTARKIYRVLRKIKEERMCCPVFECLFDKCLESPLSCKKDGKDTFRMGVAAAENPFQSPKRG